MAALRSAALLLAVTPPFAVKLFVAVFVFALMAFAIGLGLLLRRVIQPGQPLFPRKHSPPKQTR